MTSLVNKPATYNSTIIDIILGVGAVLYVKTNVPTAVMLPETVNNVFGWTMNPFNRKLTAGGSSGGESALIAFGGSRIGVGSDIGKSIPKSYASSETIRGNILQEGPFAFQQHVLASSLFVPQPADFPTTGLARG